MIKYFYSQSYRYAVYLLHDTFFKYVPILGANKFQFICVQISDGFLAEDQQKPKLLSSHPPNSQTFNQKRMVLLSPSKLFG